MTLKALKSFLAADSGAITVDWTVLTAAAVGMSLTGVAAVRTGTSSLGTSIRSSLSDSSVAMLGSYAPGGMGFDDGNFDGWSSTRLGGNDILGAFLGPFAGSDPAVTNEVTLPPGATEATIKFDVLLLDSWDGASTSYSDARLGGRGDGLSFSVDGVEIGFSAMTNSRALNPEGSFEINGSTYSYEMTRVEGGDYGYYGWNDARYSVSITATDPPNGGFTFGVNGTSNQGLNDESFGIDNYSVNAVTPLGYAR